MHLSFIIIMRFFFLLIVIHTSLTGRPSHISKIRAEFDTGMIDLVGLPE